MSNVRKSSFLKNGRVAGICLAFILLTILLVTAVQAKSEPNATLLQSPPAFFKEFSPNTILAGDKSTLFFTIDNSASASGVSNLAFSDTLPAGVVIAASPTPVVFCEAGQVIANAGESTITFTGGSTGPGSICIVAVYVTSSVPGDHVNVTGDLTSSAGNSGTATDTLTVLDFSDIGFSKAFSPNNIAYEGTSSLSFDIDNTTSEDPVTGLAFSDVLPEGITIATPANATTDCTNASLSAPDGGNTISLSNGELNGSSSCSVTLDVIGTKTATNVSSYLISSDGNSRPAIAMLTVYAAKPSFSKTFTPDNIGPGSTTSLRFDIENTETITPVMGLTFTDALPSGITIATPANATTDCTNAILSAPDGGDTISFNSGQLLGNSSCSVTINVIGNATATNISGDLTSSNGNSGPATATLTVDTNLPVFSKVFAADSIFPNEISTLTFTIDNSAAVATASNLAFTDTLPSGVVIASPPNASESCGEGTVTAVAGQDTITYSGGFVESEDICTVSVDVTSSVPGVYVNVSSELTSDLGTSSTATDVLTVMEISEIAFSKAFSPDAIGPGSTTTLRFDIDNSASATQVTDIAFTDNLPAGVTIASPASASTDCTNAILSAPDGGSSISLSQGGLGANSICSVTVNVTSNVVGAHVNTTGDLTSSTGNSGTATDTLTVAASRPGFSKGFSPSTIPFGGTSTLTFTIDNTANPGGIASMNFSDSLPADMIIATPANAVTDCGTTFSPPTLTAVAGTSNISFFANGFLPNFPAVAAGTTCTVSVNVTSTTTGIFNNISSELSFDSGNSGGFATAVLEVPVKFLNKVFINDPVIPGSSVTLQFTIQNPSRNEAATNIAFDDPLPAGLTFSSLISDDCGGTLNTATASLLSYSGGTLPAAGTCSFSVILDVPVSTLPDTYTNTTTAISATIGGEGVTGNMAIDELVVNLAPTFTKEFLDNPVGAGGVTTLRFTIINNSTTSSLDDIAFIDVFDDVLPTAATVPTNPVCNGGTATYTPFIPGGGGSSSTPARLTVSGASLAPSESCTIDIDLNVSNEAAVGTYPNTTSGITGLFDGTTPVEGVPATDDLQVVGSPTLRKEFTDDPAQPGGTVTLQFTLTYSEFAPGDATAVTFTDDLAATLAGLTTTGLPLTDICGPGNGTLSSSAGDTLLTANGITLVPGDICTFSVVLDVPDPAAAGSYPNTTSEVSATALGLEVTGNPATDVLQIGGLVLTKEFIDDPTFPGDTVTLRFTLDNQHPTDAATGIFFTDNLSSALAGLVAEAPLPDTSACGGGSSLTGTNLLVFANGSLAAGTTCSFDVSVKVPDAAAAGSYNNVTSNVSATMGSSPFVGNQATDRLTVIGGLLLTKEFTDDPVAPSGTVTLEFTVKNLSQTASATDITFTDDLDGILPGLAAVGLPATDICGTGSQISGTGLLTLTGGTLAPDETCTFSVTLQLPADTGGVTAVTNVTSDVTGSINGVAAIGDGATDQLEISLLSFSKSFDGASFPGGTAVLTFNIENLSATTGATNIKFSDNLEAVLAGLVATGPLPSNPCGAGSLLTGTSVLLLADGNLGPGGSCTFDVTVQVPATAVPGDYENITSGLILGTIEVSDPATATLTIGDETICELAAGNSYQLNQNSVPISILINSIGDLYCLNVIYTGSEHPNATDSSRFEDQYWTISGTTSNGSTASGYNLDITLPQPDLLNPRVCKYPGGVGGFGWDCDEIGGPNTSSTTTDVTRHNVTSLSDWTVANDVGPTAVGLESPQTTTGTIAWVAAALFLIAAGLSWTILRRKTGQ